MNLSLMDIKNLSPDEVVFWSWRFVSINATLVFTWAVMALLVLISVLVTRRLSSDLSPSRWQNLLEVIVGGMRDQIREISGGQDPSRYLAFIGSLFLFLALSNFLAIIPGFESPAASLSTTTGLAICVFVAVPAYGIRQKGVLGYLKHYIEPTIFMLPFNIMGELSRTLALAVRLFGNVMSGGKIVAILLALTPLFFPVVMQALGLLTAMIQAYIFPVLAMVYIASATRARQEEETEQQEMAAGTTETSHPKGEASNG